MQRCLQSFLALLLATSAHAATLTVSPGQSLTAAVSRLAPGDTLRLADGVYTEALINVIPSGTPGNPITIEAANVGTCGQPGGTCSVTLRAPDSARDEAVLVVHRSWVTIRGLDVDAQGVSRFAGDFISEAPGHLVVEQSRFHHARFSAVFLGGTTGTFRQNEIAHVGVGGQAVFGAHGMYMHGDTMLIEGNYVHDTQAGGWGIQVFASGGEPLHDNVVRGNLFVNNAAHLYVGRSNVQVRDNVLCYAGNVGMNVDTDTATITDNTVVGSTHEGINCINGFGDSLLRGNRFADNHPDTSQCHVAAGANVQMARSDLQGACTTPPVSSAPGTPPRLPAPRNLRLLTTP